MAFINPGAWLFGALFAVLIALYLWERSRRRVDVPSLLLWQVIPDAVVRTSRFRPDWLFVLQCLLLTLLIAGLADPYLRARPGAAGPARAVFVLDLSASMQAREARDTRFDLARGGAAPAHRRARRRRRGDADRRRPPPARRRRVHPRPRRGRCSGSPRSQPVDTRANLDAALAIAAARRRAAGPPGHGRAVHRHAARAARAAVARPHRGRSRSARPTTTSPSRACRSRRAASRTTATRTPTWRCATSPTARRTAC